MSRSTTERKPLPRPAMRPPLALAAVLLTAALPGAALAYSGLPYTTASDSLPPGTPTLAAGYDQTEPPGAGCEPARCSPTPACGPIEFPTVCDPAWAVGLDWLFLGRDRPDSNTELVGCNCAIPSLRFTANQFEPDSGSGIRLRAYRRNPLGVDYEFSYLDVDDWNDIRGFAGDLRVLGTSLGTTSTAFARFDSQLRGAELNALVDCDAWTRCYAGFRWVQLDEYAATGGSGGLATVSAESDVANNLLGGQIGARWLIFDEGGPWTVDLSLESGLYGNLIERDVVGFGTTGLDETRLASVSEIEIGAAYACSPCWSLNLGAHFLWLTNVASAPEQFGSPGGIADNSTIFYAGGSLGLTRVW